MTALEHGEASNFPLPEAEQQEAHAMDQTRSTAIVRVKGQGLSCLFELQLESR